MYILFAIFCSQFKLFYEQEQRLDITTLQQVHHHEIDNRSKAQDDKRMYGSSVGTFIIESLSPHEIEAAKELIIEYFHWIGVDLSFQHIEDELANFPDRYREPDGAFLLAKVDKQIVGCVGLKKIDSHVCEMKRLFVREEFRMLGIGKALVGMILAEAEKLGYTALRLDTLSWMKGAVGLYRKFGFVEIGQYVENPLPGAIFMEKLLK